jgi:hypothetical protein
LVEFCKTQYAGARECGGIENFLRCHLLVIRLLDHARDLGLLQSVRDEGQFWDNRDVEALGRRVGVSSALVALWADRLKNALGDSPQSATK